MARLHPTLYPASMRLVYSATEARARFSEVLRHVRAGKTVIVSYRGAPVAEIRPLRPAEDTLRKRISRRSFRGAGEEGGSHASSQPPGTDEARPPRPGSPGQIPSRTLRQGRNLDVQ